jgi:hypothetical protein
MSRLAKREVKIMISKVYVTARCYCRSHSTSLALVAFSRHRNFSLPARATTRVGKSLHARCHRCNNQFPGTSARTLFSDSVTTNLVRSCRVKILPNLRSGTAMKGTRPYKVQHTLCFGKSQVSKMTKPTGTVSNSSRHKKAVDFTG